MKKDSFKIPESFLNQLEEFTTGYYLVALNEVGEFTTHPYFPTPASAMALINFVEIDSSALQESLRIRATEEAMGSEGEDTDEEN